MKRARTAKRSRPTGSAAGGGDATRLVVPAVAPRNPFVAHAHRRKGGAHGGGARVRRQAEKRELKKLLEE
jgi:hypothetical protein